MRGRTYGVLDVDVGFLQFDVSRQLRLLGVGDDCGPGFCRSNPGHTDSFYIVYDSQSRLDRFFGVAGDSTFATSYGPGMMLLAPVPEPGQFSLLLGGLACVGLFVRGRSGAAFMTLHDRSTRAIHKLPATSEMGSAQAAAGAGRAGHDRVDGLAPGHCPVRSPRGARGKTSGTFS